MENKVLITDMHHKSDIEEQSVYRDTGIQLNTAMCLTEDDLIKNGAGYQGFLVSYAPVTRKVMEALPGLEVMVKYGIGVDNIDVRAATDLGKVVANVPDAASEEVALQALTLLLNGLRSTDFLARSVRKNQWVKDPEPLIPYRVSEISLGLIGYGRIPHFLARFAKPLFSSIYVYDPYCRSEEIESSGLTAVKDLKELFRRCSAISVHAPLNDSTKGFINSDLIKLSKRLVLVNTSRGGVVDMPSIVEALRSDKLEFFGSDVFWTEPADFSDPDVKYLINHDRVLITPHVGWCSQPAAAQMRRTAAKEALNVLSGLRAVNTVNPEVYEKRSDLIKGAVQ
jgi:D-3-phosphoglycerate dehydrogenase